MAKQVMNPNEIRAELKNKIDKKITEEHRAAAEVIVSLMDLDALAERIECMIRDKIENGEKTLQEEVEGGFFGQSTNTEAISDILDKFVAGDHQLVNEMAWGMALDKVLGDAYSSRIWVERDPLGWWSKRHVIIEW